VDEVSLAASENSRRGEKRLSGAAGMMRLEALFRLKGYTGRRPEAGLVHTI